MRSQFQPNVVRHAGSALLMAIDVKTLRTVTAALVLLAASPAVVAQGHEFEGEGTVVAVNVVKSTVTLDHGPIPGLMPPMRMRFTVDGRDQLRRLRVGDAVRFSLGSRGHELVILTIERLPTPEPDRR